MLFLLFVKIRIGWGWDWLGDNRELLVFSRPFLPFHQAEIEK